MVRIVLLCAGLLLSSCTGGEEALVIGVAGPPEGEAARAVRLAARRAGRPSLPLEVVPLEGSEGLDVAVVPEPDEQARRLAGRGVAVVVVGPEPPPAPPPAGVFALLPDGTWEGRALAELIRADGLETVGLMVEDRRGQQAAAQAFEASFTAAGGRVAHRVGYRPDDPPFTLPLQELLLAEPEAFVCLCALPAGASILEDAFVLGLMGRPWYYGGRMRAEGVAGRAFPDRPGALAGQRGVSLRLPDPPSAPGYPEFAAAFREAYQQAPGTGAALAYDAALLAAATAAAHGADGRAIAGNLARTSREGLPCRALECLEAAGRGEDVDYQGVSGDPELGDDGAPTRVEVEVWRFTLDGDIELLDVLTYTS